MREPEAIPWLGGQLTANRHGVFHLRDIQDDVRSAVLACEIQPPVFPIFLPKFADNPEHGEGLLVTEYSFQRQRAYWGQFGAAGVAIRRTRADGDREYLLGRRSNVSSGNGDWAFFGGAHDSREHATDPIQTVMKELEEEAGILLDSATRIVGRLAFDRDPHWRYDTFVAEPDEEVAQELRVTLNWEHSEADWFSVAELLAMRDRGELFRPVARDLPRLLAAVSEDLG